MIAYLIRLDYITILLFILILLGHLLLSLAVRNHHLFVALLLYLNLTHETFFLLLIRLLPILERKIVIFKDGLI
jgi:hypothetical protein